jgi:hypothetical protein
MGNVAGSSLLGSPEGNGVSFDEEVKRKGSKSETRAPTSSTRAPNSSSPR